MSDSELVGISGQGQIVTVRQLWELEPGTHVSEPVAVTFFVLERLDRDNG